MIGIARPVALLALTLWGSAAFGQSVMGEWVTDDHSAIIRVAPCGPKLCGTIQRVLDPKAPEKDINNPDPALRSRPLVGVPVLSGFTQAGAGWENGLAYDPKAGKSYKSHMALGGPRQLDITGCVLFLCQTKHWTRAEGSEAASR